MSIVTDERAPRTRMTYVARLTIAISATTSALLIAFAAIVWVQLSAITDRDFDRDLAATARHGFSGRPTGMMNLRQAEALFAVQADRMDLKEYFFVVQRPDTGLTFVSANWPEGFTPSSVSK